MGFSLNFSWIFAKYGIQSLLIMFKPSQIFVSKSLRRQQSAFSSAKTQLRDDQGIDLAIAGRRRHARCIAAAGAKEVCSSFARIDVGVLK